VTVRLITITEGHFGLHESDVVLAREISAIARGLHAPPDPANVQTIQIAIDALVLPEVMPFWRAVLGYQDRGNGDEDLFDPRGRGPLFWFQQMEEPRPQRNRIHVDVWVPHDLAEARGAREGPARDRHARTVVVDARGRRGQRGGRLHVAGASLKGSVPPERPDLDRPGLDLAPRSRPSPRRSSVCDGTCRVHVAPRWSRRQRNRAG
jgi:hypothetical protein